MRRPVVVAATCLAVAVAAAYLPDVGRGFIKDDFAWIFHGRIRTLDTLSALCLAEAAHVHFGDRQRLWVEPPSREMQTAGMDRPEGEAILVLRLHEGEVVREP